MEIKGITVKLHEKVETGKDEFDAPIYEDTTIDVENVLVVPVTAEDVTTRTSLKSDKVVYKLAIPKGDNHTWTDCVVEFFGEKFKVVGKPVQGIEELLPLAWNKQMQVEHYG